MASKELSSDWCSLVMDENYKNNKYTIKLPYFYAITKGLEI